MSAHTFPVAPVLRLARVQLGEKLGYLPADGELADYLGVSIRTVLRWRHAPDAVISIAMAERVAESLGYHPVVVWPESYAKIIDEERRLHQVRRAAATQRWRENNREHVRQYNRAYYQANAAFYQADARRRRSRIDPDTGVSAGAAAMRQLRARRAVLEVTPGDVTSACVNGDTDNQEVA